MKALNPIFENKTKITTSLSPGDNVRKKPITKKEGRKVRCDKKKDVKIPFTDSERRLIKKLAKLRNLEPTPYCSMLLKKGLKQGIDFPYKKYNPKGKPYPAKLEEYYCDLLFEYKVKWDCSFKESAYRIISYMLEIESRLLP